MSAGAPAAAAARRRRARRVLLVEDDESTRHGDRMFLAATAIGSRGRRRGASRPGWERQRPDLIVLDLGLPDARRHDLIRRVRREAATPILILSARAARRTRSLRSTSAPTTT